MFKEEAFTKETTQQEGQEDYVKERNKPLPDRIHGCLQAQLNYLLVSDYGDKYLFPNEVTLATEPIQHTPDICIYPKRKIEFKKYWNTNAEKEPPISTIEIKSFSQSVYMLQKKVYDYYFSFGVKSAWIVIPEIKAVQVITGENNQGLYNTGKLKDPVTNIELSVEKIFEDLG